MLVAQCHGSKSARLSTFACFISDLDRNTWADKHVILAATVALKSLWITLHPTHPQPAAEDAFKQQGSSYWKYCMLMQLNVTDSTDVTQGTQINARHPNSTELVQLNTFHSSMIRVIVSHHTPSKHMLFKNNLIYTSIIVSPKN